MMGVKLEETVDGISLVIYRNEYFPSEIYI